jgi:hypothetical protein
MISTLLYGGASQIRKINPETPGVLLSNLTLRPNVL